MRNGARMRGVAVAAAILGVAATPAASAADAGIASYVIIGDAIADPLDGLVGDAARGRRLVTDRDKGNCLICHQVSVPNEPSQGDLAPTLDGVGKRLTAAQIRLRLVDQSRLNPATIMPPFHRIEGLVRVAGRYRGHPVFSPQDIEDVVAWLATLKD